MFSTFHRVKKWEKHLYIHPFIGKAMMSVQDPFLGHAHSSLSSSNTPPLLVTITRTGTLRFLGQEICHPFDYQKRRKKKKRKTPRKTRPHLAHAQSSLPSLEAPRSPCHRTQVSGRPSSSAARCTNHCAPPSWP